MIQLCNHILLWEKKYSIKNRLKTFGKYGIQEKFRNKNKNGKKHRKRLVINKLRYCKNDGKNKNNLNLEIQSL